MSWDGYEGRAADKPQSEERFRLEFYNDGELVAWTASTPDLTASVETAWWIGDLGTVELPDGADEVRAVHANQFDGTSGDNSVVPSSICLEPAQPHPLLSRRRR